jgi:hypothetical protein
MIQIALNLGVVPIDQPGSSNANRTERKPKASESH